MIYFVYQVTDFNQRRNDRLSNEGDELPVTEQDLRKLKNPDTEQELEVRCYCVLFITFLYRF